MNVLLPGSTLIGNLKALSKSGGIFDLLGLMSGGNKVGGGIGGGIGGLKGGVGSLASGGIVPPGFNNDTYPAMLSSGETVIPSPQALPSYGRNQRLTVSLPLRQLVIALEDERERMGRS
jgi:hypothetical protein